MRISHDLGCLCFRGKIPSNYSEDPEWLSSTGGIALFGKLTEHVIKQTSKFLYTWTNDFKFARKTLKLR